MKRCQKKKTEKKKTETFAGENKKPGDIKAPPVQKTEIKFSVKSAEKSSAQEKACDSALHMTTQEGSHGLSQFVIDLRSVQSVFPIHEKNAANDIAF